MDWKEKLKWKILTILIALAGILIVWCAGKAGERRGNAQRDILKEYMIKENEWASAGADFKEGNLQQESEEQDETKVEDEIEAQDEIAAEQTAAEISEPNIRVLLMTDGYKGYYHEKISLQFQGNYEMQGKDSRTISDGETLEILPGSELFSDGKLTLVPQAQNNRVKVWSLKRGQGNPSYRGNLTIYEDENGLRMVNELPLEQYLCGVVPSEMPATYPMEALKAQAVCARTYVCVQMQGSKLENLGAQVDDSVSFQVYQNSAEADTANEAVNATNGQVLMNNGAPINAYYFSTSHGKTSTDEVWEASVPASYLKSVECSYDSDQPWYQWSVTISKDRILQNVQKKFSDIKTVDSVEIREKGEGDAVLNLVLHTNQGEKEIHSEYDIRSILAPLGQSITRQDGSAVKGSALLPSAYFTMEEQRNDSGSPTGYLIRGGGYGHGVGMSQNGAKGMAESGKSYGEILSYFYNDVEIGNINDIVN